MAAVVVAKKRVVRAGRVRCMVNVLRKLGFGVCCKRSTG
jgi:hypothetical protein